MAASQRSRGRPRVPDETRKRNNVTIRMRDELKARVEQSAGAQQRSISEEIEQRLEASFADEDRFGGPAMRPVVDMLIGAFLNGGQRAAAASGHPEWAPAEWLDDEICYRTAAHALGQALGLPPPPKAQMSDPYAVREVLTSLLAAGADFTIHKEPKK